MLKTFLNGSLIPGSFYFAPDDNDGDNDDLGDDILDVDIDAILNGEDGDDGDADKDSDDAQKSKSKKKDANNKNKNYQELFRQQSEEMKSMKEENKKLQQALEKQSKITGKLEKVFSNDDEMTKQQELEKRRKFQANAPDEVQKMIQESEQRIMSQFTKSTLERDLKDVYREIQKDYEVDLNKIPQDVLDTVDMFSKEARKSDPKKVILASYAMRGKLKKRDPEFTNFEGGGSNGSRVSTKQEKSEADTIKERLVSGVSGGSQSKNVFGI